MIDRVEHKGDRDALPNVMQMVLSPYESSWQFDKGDAKTAESDAERFCGDVPEFKTGMQCSCSS